MQELTLTPATLILLAFIGVWIVWAIRRLVGRGLCDCHDHGDGGCAGCSGCKTSQNAGGCAGCTHGLDKKLVSH